MMGRSVVIFLRLGIIVSAAMILLALFGHAHAATAVTAAAAR